MQSDPRSLIYTNLLRLINSGKFNEYAPDGICNMSCFNNIKIKIGKPNLFNYVGAYLDNFIEELYVIMKQKNNKLRPASMSELFITPTMFDMAFISLSLESIKQLNQAMRYLISHPKDDYQDLDHQNISEYSNSRFVINKQSQHFIYNALEILPIDEQMVFLTTIVNNELLSDDSLISPFASCLINSDNCDYGDVVLMVKSVLPFYDDEALEECITYFRELDAGSIDYEEVRCLTKTMDMAALEAFAESKRCVPS